MGQQFVSMLSKKKNQSCKQNKNDCSMSYKNIQFYVQFKVLPTCYFVIISEIYLQFLSKNSYNV